MILYRASRNQKKRNKKLKMEKKGRMLQEGNKLRRLSHKEMGEVGTISRKKKNKKNILNKM